MTRRATAVGVVLAAAAGVMATVWLRAAADEGPAVPTIAVQRGRVEVVVHAIGDLRPMRATQFFTPSMGGPLTVVQLAPSGQPVRTGDTLVEFDAAEQEFALEQATFDLAVAEQELAKADAERAVTAAEDEVALLQARFAVRRAELDAGANELVGALIARQNLLLLEEARQKLAALEQEIRGRTETSTASTFILREKRNKAHLSVDVARRNIDQLHIRAPFDGFVTIKPNTMAFGGVIFSPAALPDYRVGDAAYPGQLIAELVDTTRVEITAKLPEQDRTNIAPGQRAAIVIDAMPDGALTGTVRAVSSVASRQLFDSGVRRFDIAFDITAGEVRARPGVSAALAISGQTFDDALHVPRAAVFEVDGQPSVYVRTGSGFERREVTVRARTDGVAVIEGVDAAAEVALVDPGLGAKAGATRSHPANRTLR